MSAAATVLVDKWTDADERALNKMVERRAAVRQRRVFILRAAIQRLSLDVDRVDIDLLTEELIKSADAITDALAPFTTPPVEGAEA